MHLQPAVGITVTEQKAATSKDISLANLKNFEFLQYGLSSVAPFANTTCAVHIFGSVHTATARKISNTELRKSWLKVPAVS